MWCKVKRDQVHRSGVIIINLEANFFNQIIIIQNDPGNIAFPGRLFAAIKQGKCFEGVTVIQVN